MGIADLRTWLAFAMRGSLLWAALAATLFVPGCAVRGGAARHEPSEISFNLSEDPATLDPLFARSDDERRIEHLMFDFLLDVDDRGRLVPDLALEVPSRTNHDVSPDGRTIVYHLRSDVQWQDGKPLTAADVIFTWEAITDPRNNVPSTLGYDLIDLVFAPDPYTVVVQMRRPWAPAVATFFTYGSSPEPILPAHLLQDQGDLGHAAFNLHPIGSGPYRLVRWDRDDRLVFAANASYFRGKPSTPQVVAHIVPDTNTSLTMLRSGQLDWSLLSPAQRLALGPGSGIRFTYVPFSGVGAIAFNCRRPPLDDERLRTALAMAIDRQRLSAGITAGQYRVAQSDQPPFSWAHDASVALPAFDPRAADARLDALGWRRGPDGVRRKDGRALALTFATFPESDTAVRTAEYVQQMLAQRGIVTNVKKVSLAQFYLPASEHGLLHTGRFDLAYFVWQTGLDPDDSDLVTCDGAANYAGYCDRALDALEAQALSQQSTSRRRSLYFEIQRRLAVALPYDFLYAPRYSYAESVELRGFSPSPFSPTWNSYEWSKR